MSIVDWNKAPIGTTHVYVPPCSEPLRSIEFWEKWADGKVYLWNDEYDEWDLMSYSDKLVPKDRRAPNPNLEEIL